LARCITGRLPNGENAICHQRGTLPR
jgi:hypothetical protein